MILRLRILLILFFFQTAISCKSTATVVEMNALKEVVESQNFNFVADSANPMPIANVSGLQNLLPRGSNMANINLNDITNFLNIKGDLIDLDMPYYGVNRMVTTYNTRNVGMQFKGKIKSSDIKFNAKKNKYTLKYTIKTDMESLALILVMFPNQTATLSINSSHRNSISYNGKWKAE